MHSFAYIFPHGLLKLQVQNKMEYNDCCTPRIV